MVEVHDAVNAHLSDECIREQLQRIVQDDVFRSSKRSVAFLTYVIQEVLKNPGEQIKERTIGIDVFGRSSSYDTSLDHIVRTAATEVRKRLAIYYGSESHRGELRISLVPGAYAPQFAPPHTSGNGTIPNPPAIAVPDPDSTHAAVAGLITIAGTAEEHAADNRPLRRRFRPGIYLFCAALVAIAVLVAVAALGLTGWVRRSPTELFWQPVLSTPGSLLLAVGDVPSGPPTMPDAEQNPELPVPQADHSETVPLSDAVTMARVVGSLNAYGKEVVIRSESASSFSDLRQSAVVLIGAFNNEWSLRLTRPLQYSLALDPVRHLIYIRDSKNPSARNWSWATNQSSTPATGINSPKLRDYALISRIQTSETGHVVVVIGGLYSYGTQAAGEFLTNPKELGTVVKAIHEAGSSGNLQIVLETTVTDGTPGPPKVVAVSTE